MSPHKIGTEKLQLVETSLGDASLFATTIYVVEVKHPCSQVQLSATDLSDKLFQTGNDELEIEIPNF